jgi:hypothetical protein
MAVHLLEKVVHSRLGLEISFPGSFSAPPLIAAERGREEVLADLAKKSGWRSLLPPW